jgi:hypothetical protein
MPLPKTFGRYGDPDAHGKSSFGSDDHVARVAWHQVFLVHCSFLSENAAGPPVLSSPLGVQGG